MADAIARIYNAADHPRPQCLRREYLFRVS